MFKKIFLFCVLYCTAIYGSLFINQEGPLANQGQYFTDQEWITLSNLPFEDPKQEIVLLSSMVLKDRVNRVNFYVPINKKARYARCDDHNPGETLLASYCIFPQKIHVIKWLLNNGAKHLPDSTGQYPIHNIRDYNMLGLFTENFGKEILFILNSSNKKLLDTISDDLIRLEQDFRLRIFLAVTRCAPLFRWDKDGMTIIDKNSDSHNKYIIWLYNFKSHVELGMQPQ